MFHQRAGLDKAARVDGKSSESPVGSLWLRTEAGMATSQPSDKTPMIFVHADGAVYTANQWLIHEATLACSVDPRMRPYLCEFRAVYHGAGKAWTWRGNTATRACPRTFSFDRSDT